MCNRQTASGPIPVCGAAVYRGRARERQGRHGELDEREKQTRITERNGDKKKIKIESEREKNPRLGLAAAAARCASIPFDDRVSDCRRRRRRRPVRSGIPIRSRC